MRCPTPSGIRTQTHPPVSHFLLHLPCHIHPTPTPLDPTHTLSSHNTPNNNTPLPSRPPTPHHTTPHHTTPSIPSPSLLIKKESVSVDWLSSSLCKERLGAFSTVRLSSLTPPLAPDGPSHSPAPPSLPSCPIFTYTTYSTLPPSTLHSQHYARYCTVQYRPDRTDTSFLPLVHAAMPCPAMLCHAMPCPPSFLPANVHALPSRYYPLSFLFPRADAALVLRAFASCSSSSSSSKKKHREAPSLPGFCRPCINQSIKPEFANRHGFIRCRPHSHSLSLTLIFLISLFYLSRSLNTRFS
ncbi:hypothetical protein LY76DRAFT_250979 [Colletotrichum caudatum]|nr:hypothetical protein LY76DRAFT_250979 [Colletotrichum caudatum]